MSLDDIIATDAEAIHDLDGLSVVVTTSSGDLNLKMIPLVGELEPKESMGNRTLSKEVVVTVAKTDYPSPVANADTIANLPAEWFRRVKPGSATVTATVSDYRGDLSEPGVWFLELTA